MSAQTPTVSTPVTSSRAGVASLRPGINSGRSTAPSGGGGGGGSGGGRRVASRRRLAGTAEAPPTRGGLSADGIGGNVGAGGSSPLAGAGGSHALLSSAGGGGTGAGGEESAFSALDRLVPVKVYTERDVRREVEESKTRLDHGSDWKLWVSAMRRLAGVALGGAATEFPGVLVGLVRASVHEAVGHKVGLLDVGVVSLRHVADFVTVNWRL